MASILSDHSIPFSRKWYGSKCKNLPFYIFIIKKSLFLHSFLLELPQIPITFIMHLKMWNLSSYATWFLRFYKIAFLTYAHINCLIEWFFFFLFVLFFLEGVNFWVQEQLVKGKLGFSQSTILSPKLNLVMPGNNKGLCSRANIYL